VGTHVAPSAELTSSLLAPLSLSRPIVADASCLLDGHLRACSARHAQHGASHSLGAGVDAQLGQYLEEMARNGG
jgi:hypothetical protein